VQDGNLENNNRPSQNHIIVRVTDGPSLAQSANWLKRTDRLLCREAETSAKNPDTFIFG